MKKKWLTEVNPDISNTEILLDNILGYFNELNILRYAELATLIETYKLEENYKVLFNLLMHEKLIDQYSNDGYKITPLGTRVFLDGGYLKYKDNLREEKKLAQRKYMLEVRNAKFALPISITSALIAIGSLIYTIFFKRA